MARCLNHEACHSEDMKTSILLFGFNALLLGSSLSFLLVTGHAGFLVPIATSVFVIGSCGLRLWIATEVKS